MMNTRLHFVLSVVAGLFAVAAPLRAANVLYFRDAPIGPDRVAEALGGLGHNVTRPNNADSFQALLESGNFDLGIIFVQTRPAAEYASAIQALSTFVSDGGRALYSDWSRNAALAAGFGAGFTGGDGGRGATLLSLEPGNTLVPSLVKLRNTGWFHATNGLTALNDSTVAATFANGAAAVVRGSTGRSLVFGFLGDTPDTAAIFARGAEAVLAPTFRPVIAHDAANPSLHSVDLHGFVVPTNAATEVRVEYGQTATYGGESAVQFIPGGYLPVPVEITIDDLAPHTTYHYRFRTSNLAGESSSADLTFTTLNTLPIANDDRTLAPVASAFSVQPLPNDTDADGDALTIVDVTQGGFGSVTFDAGAVTYTAAPAGLRGDAFTYTISDGFGGSATATVFIDVPLPQFRGDYTQLLVEPDSRIAGRLTLTLGAGGAFTGRVLLDGRSDPIAGVFGSNGSAHFVKERGDASSIVFDLALLLTDAGPRIVGGISDGIQTWPLNSGGVLYDFVRVPPYGKGGRYTLATIDPGDRRVPRGEAWAVFAGHPEGRLRLRGRFADGELFFADCQVQPDGTLPLYVLRKNPPVESLAGTLRFRGDRGGVFDGELTWTRFSTKNHDGFSVTSDVQGGRYHPPLKDELILRVGLSEWAKARLHSNASGFPWNQLLWVRPDGLFPLLPSDRVTLQFTRRTGQFTGSFNHPTLGPCRISAVLLQQENLVRGNFSGDGFSGRFRVIPLPF